MAELIIVGAGSGACKIVNGFAKRIKNEGVQNDYTKTICIDSDEELIKKLQNDTDSHGNKFVDHIIQIQKPELLRTLVKEAKKELVTIDGKIKEYYRLLQGSIFHDKNEILGIFGHGGVGTRRSASHVLLFEIAQNFETVYNTFESLHADSIDRVTGANSKYMVWIIAGSGGGSGSGLVTGVARIIKSVFRDNCDINLLLLLPVRRGGITTPEDSTAINSYLLIKEIEYLRKLDEDEESQDILGHKIITGGNNLFFSINFMSMRHFSEDEKGREVIQNSIIPGFLRMFRYGTNINIADINLNPVDPTILIEMQNYGVYLAKAAVQKGGRYGTINFFEVYYDDEKLTEICKLRDYLDNLGKISSELELDRKIKNINKLLNGSEEFNKIKSDEFGRPGNVKDKWNELLDTENKEYKDNDIGMVNLLEARDRLTGWPLGRETNDSKRAEIKFTTVRDNFKNECIQTVTDINNLIKSDIKIKSIIDSKSFSLEDLNYEDCLINEYNEYISRLENVIKSFKDEILNRCIDQHKNLLEEKKTHIIENSELGVVNVFPNFDKRKTRHQNEILFDKVYEVYTDNNRNLDYRLSQFMEKMGDDPRAIAGEKCRLFLGLGKEYSTFEFNRSLQKHPLNWAVCFTKDDNHFLIQEWGNLGTVGGYMMDQQRDCNLHTLPDTEYWPKNKWCVVSWINGYPLEKSLDFKELKDAFEKVKDYTQIIYPEAFTAVTPQEPTPPVKIVEESIDTLDSSNING